MANLVTQDTDVSWNSTSANMDYVDIPSDPQIWDLPPRGGLIQRLPQLRADRGVIKEEVPVTLLLGGGGKGSGDKLDFEVYWSVPLPKYLTDLWKKDTRVVFELNFRSKRLEKTIGGITYYGVDKPTYAFDLGGLIRDAILLKASAYFRDSSWFYTAIITGFVREVIPPYEVVLWQYWNTTNTVFDGKNNPMGVKLSWYVTLETSQISRISPSEGSAEQPGTEEHDFVIL